MTMNHPPPLSFIPVDIRCQCLQSENLVILPHLDLFCHKGADHALTSLHHNQFCLNFDTSRRITVELNCSLPIGDESIASLMRLSIGITIGHIISLGPQSKHRRTVCMHHL